MKANQSILQLIRSVIVTGVSALFLIVLFSGEACAQQKEEDVLYLKNGSILRGSILEHKPGEYVKITTDGRNVWVFKMEEIDRITREPYKYVTRKKKILANQKGYFNISEIGLTMSGGGWSGFTAGFSLSTINGYRYNRYLSAGILTGIDHYYGLPMIPVALDVRGTLRNKSVSPFYFGQAGYSFPMPYDEDNSKYKGGLLLNVGAGMMFTLNEDCALIWSLSFKSQRMQREYDPWWGRHVEEKNNYRRISIKLGLMF